MNLRLRNIAVSNATRISVGLVFIVLSVLGVCFSLGLLPDHTAERTTRQLDVARSLAIQFSAAVSDKNATAVQELAGNIAGSIDDIRGIGLRRSDGQLFFATPDHAARWTELSSGKSSQSLEPFKVGIFDQGREWGQLELIFAGEPPTLRGRMSGFVLFFGAACLLAFMLFMARTLRVLDPSQVVPERVRSMLDTLTEGAAIIDADGRIVLANQSLGRLLGAAPHKLLGTSLDSLTWKMPGASTDDPASHRTELPWKPVRGEVLCRGEMVHLHTSTGSRSLMVNASSILGSRGQSRGSLITFDDVTGIEQKNQQLVEMVQKLGEAQQRVQKQNDELARLATRDALTDCLNRRSFMEQLETLFLLNRRNPDQPLSVIMVDIDHFKSINDNHGHTRGDEALRGVAAALRRLVRASDVVCRYGGEEFAILLPMTDLVSAQHVAQKLCQAIASEHISGLTITISLGISCTSQNPSAAGQLIDQADQALYFSKRTGRNRATRFDQIDPTLTPTETRRDDRQRDTTGEYIPVHATRSLLAALSFRDPRTGEHSRRVADLCVRAAREWLSARELLIMETAALLHDIGKIGVPDSVLLKPGPLTAEEWTLMRQHDRIGVEIVNTAFCCPQLTSIISRHHARHEWNAQAERLERGELIPLCARLLAIADAYDAMVSHRVYRAAVSQADALAELRRCAGTQFDPVLVEHFITMVQCDESAAAQSNRSEQLATTLRLNMEAESIAGALLQKDLETTLALARHLADTANSVARPNIAQQCQQLSESIQSTSDMSQLIGCARQLLDVVSSDATRLIENKPR